MILLQSMEYACVHSCLQTVMQRMVITQAGDFLAHL